MLQLVRMLHRDDAACLGDISAWQHNITNQCVQKSAFACTSAPAVNILLYYALKRKGLVQRQR